MNELKKKNGGGIKVAWKGEIQENLSLSLSSSHSLLPLFFICCCITACFLPSVFLCFGVRKKERETDGHRDRERQRERVTEYYTEGDKESRERSNTKSTREKEIEALRNRKRSFRSIPSVISFFLKLTLNPSLCLNACLLFSFSALAR